MDLKNCKEYNEMDIQKLIEAKNNYIECYKEAKHYTSYKNSKPKNDHWIVRELYEKSWRCEDAKFPIVLIGGFIVFVYILMTTRNTLRDAYVLFLILIGGILIELNLTYWMNKYKHLADDLEKAMKQLDIVEKEYKNTPREYKER